MRRRFCALTAFAVLFLGAALQADPQVDPLASPSGGQTIPAPPPGIGSPIAPPAPVSPEQRAKELERLRELYSHSRWVDGQSQGKDEKKDYQPTAEDRLREEYIRLTAEYAHLLNKNQLDSNLAKLNDALFEHLKAIDATNTKAAADLTNVRKSLDELAKKYPNTEAGIKAKQLMRELDQMPAPAKEASPAFNVRPASYTIPSQLPMSK